VSDEVSGGPDAPGRGRAALVVLVAVAVAALAVTALRRGVDSPDTALPTRSPAASVPPPPSLALDQVCRPVRVTGPDALDVSFSLRNNTGAPATLVSVEPRLPLAGLLERGYTIRSGGCPATGGTLTDSRLERSDPVTVPPIGSVVATLHFALPDECPKPYPVQVVVTELPEPAAPTVNTPYTLLADLGEVSFPNC
jgi:hypothetical protein